MMITIVSFLLLVLAVFSSSPAVEASTLDARPEDMPLACPICRTNDRPMLNPDHQFTMSNGITWTCHYLQETVQDVEMNGWESERIMCRQAQLQAEDHGCLCGGVPLPPFSSQVNDINPACDMCAGSSSSTYSYGIPFVNTNKLVNTGIVGTHNCQGLFDALADGILSSNLCPQIQAIAGQECCVDPNAVLSTAAAAAAAADTTTTFGASTSTTATYNAAAISTSTVTSTAMIGAPVGTTTAMGSSAGTNSQTSSQYMVPPPSLPSVAMDTTYAIDYNTGTTTDTGASAIARAQAYQDAGVVVPPQQDEDDTTSRSSLRGDQRGRIQEREPRLADNPLP